MYVIKKIYNSTKWSFAGFKFAYRNELAFRLEVWTALILTPLAFYIARNQYQLILLLISLHLVLLCELANTAIEAVVDRISADHHLLSKHAKDVGSALVFYAICLAAVVWAIIIYNIMKFS